MILNEPSYELERHTRDEYFKLGVEIYDRRGKVSVIGSPMGTGKSTYFILMYAATYDVTVNVVTPNR